MKTLFLCFSGVLAYLSIYGQIRGTITDAETGSPLTGAHIVLYEHDGQVPFNQTISGRKGEYLLPGTYNRAMDLSVSYVGYRIVRISLGIPEGPVQKDIALPPALVPVGEVTVSAERRQRNLIDVSIPMAVAGAPQIDQKAGITPSDLFRNEPGLAVARDGIWATSLNIRGLSEQRIVTLVDGNRVETATDLAAGMSMMDLNDIERIEVIKGASSSLYGTGAMGGVVNIITRDGYYHDGLYASGSLGGSYQTVNRMHSQHASALTGNRNWYLRVSGTLRDAQNTMTPEGELLNSQFRDNNLSLKTGFRLSDAHEFKISFQQFHASDAGMPGGKSFPGPATATYTDASRRLFSATYLWKPRKGMVKDVQLKYFNQYILRDVELKPNPTTTITPSGYHLSNGLQLQTDLVEWNGHALVAGIDAWQRKLTTEREKTVLQGTNTVVRGEVPIPESYYKTIGLFVQDEFRPTAKLKITAGGRFDVVNVQNEEAVDPLYTMLNGVRNDNPPLRRITFEENNVNNYSWSANLGALYRVHSHIDLTASLSRAFRSPSLEERFKYIDLLSTVRIGDPHLSPEKGWFSDAGIRIWYEKFQASGNIFLNSMKDLIVEIPGTYIYNYTDDPGNFDTIPALINANVDKALLYGYEFVFDYNLYTGFSVTGKGSFIRGIEPERNSDLPQIPPFFGSLSLKYNHPKWFGAEIVCNLTADQDKIAEGESATKGYASYDLRIFSQPIDLKFVRLHAFSGIENFTDRAYINHLATNRGIIRYEPGRNFYLKLRFEF